MSRIRRVKDCRLEFLYFSEWAMASVIAEFCQNHNGDRAILRDMISAAAEAGADFAKVQAVFADDLTARERFDGGLIEGGEVRAIDRPFDREYERLKPLEFPIEDYEWFIDACNSASIKPLTTVFTRAQIPTVSRFPFEAVKVASYDCASYPMIEELAASFPHLFVSTGATWNHEIEHTAGLLKGKSFTFLHCVTVYPTPLDQMHLSRLDYLRGLAPSVGLSDHSAAEDGLKASAVSLLLGAEVIEKHFTILPPTDTKDGPVSATPNDLRELCRLARASSDVVSGWVEEAVGDYSYMIGNADRCLSPEELLNRDYYRGRFASKTAAGEVFNFEEKPVGGATGVG